jgi:hypothetical protein
MKKFTFLMATALVLTGISLSVQAQVSVSGPFTTSTPIPSTETVWNSSLAFPQFDPSLGTLQSVTLELSYTFSTTLTVSNLNVDTGASGNAKTEVIITVQDPEYSALNAPEFDVNSAPFAYSLGGGGSASSGLLTKSGNDGGNTYTSGSLLTEFTGPGTIVLPASATADTLLDEVNGNTSAIQITDASLTGTVTYDYIAVPEPSTIGLVVVGLLGVLGLRRRKA